MNKFHVSEEEGQEMIRPSNLTNHYVEKDSTFDSIMVFRPQVGV